jgi:hypothetical protein
MMQLISSWCMSLASSSTAIAGPSPERILFDGEGRGDEDPHRSDLDRTPSHGGQGRCFLSDYRLQCKK